MEAGLFDEFDVVNEEDVQNEVTLTFIEVVSIKMSSQVGYALLTRTHKHQASIATTSYRQNFS